MFRAFCCFTLVQDTPGFTSWGGGAGGEFRVQETQQFFQRPSSKNIIIIGDHLCVNCVVCELCCTMYKKNNFNLATKTFNHHHKTPKNDKKMNLHCSLKHVTYKVQVGMSSAQR